jgi:CRISPR/Cas system-associated endonuclease Cas3-HD
MGALATELGGDAGISDLARTGALLHDIGKYFLAFQRKLEGGHLKWITPPPGCNITHEYFVL